MSRSVKLTKTAEIQLQNLLEYLETAWTIKVKKDFVRKLDDCVSNVSTNPNLFPRSFLKKGLHKCVVTKQTSFFYIHNNTTITILAIFDARQNPKKLSSQIRTNEK